jgi:hypothetical protein
LTISRDALELVTEVQRDELLDSRIGIYEPQCVDAEEPMDGVEMADVEMADVEEGA